MFSAFYKVLSYASKYTNSKSLRERRPRTLILSCVCGMIDKPIFSITPTSGGVIKLENVICRDAVINYYWQFLRIKGIPLFAERRFGKSSIIRKMANELMPEFVTIYKSVQGIKSIDDFVEVLYTKAKEEGLIDNKNTATLTKTWNTIADVVPEAF